MYYMVPSNQPSVGDYIEVGEDGDQTTLSNSAAAIRIGDFSFGGVFALVVLGLAAFGGYEGYKVVKTKGWIPKFAGGSPAK